MPGVARRNRVFGGTLKLRDYERARAESRRRRGTTASWPSTSLAGAEDSQRVVVMLISHLPNRTP